MTDRNPFGPFDFAGSEPSGPAADFGSAGVDDAGDTERTWTASDWETRKLAVALRRAPVTVLHGSSAKDRRALLDQALLPLLGRRQLDQPAPGHAAHTLPFPVHRGAASQRGIDEHAEVVVLLDDWDDVPIGSLADAIARACRLPPSAAVAEHDKPVESLVLLVLDRFERFLALDPLRGDVAAFRNELIASLHDDPLGPQLTIPIEDDARAALGLHLLLVVDDASRPELAALARQLPGFGSQMLQLDSPAPDVLDEPQPAQVAPQAPARAAALQPAPMANLPDPEPEPEAAPAVAAAAVEPRLDSAPAVESAPPALQPAVAESDEVWLAAIEKSMLRVAAQGRADSAAPPLSAVSKRVAASIAASVQPLFGGAPPAEIDAPAEPVLPDPVAEATSREDLADTAVAETQDQGAVDVEQGALPALVLAPASAEPPALLRPAAAMAVEPAPAALTDAAVVRDAEAAAPAVVPADAIAAATAATAVDSAMLAEPAADEPFPATADRPAPATPTAKPLAARRPMLVAGLTIALLLGAGILVWVLTGMPAETATPVAVLTPSPSPGLDPAAETIPASPEQQLARAAPAAGIPLRDPTRPELPLPQASPAPRPAAPPPGVPAPPQPSPAALPARQLAAVLAPLPLTDLRDAGADTAGLLAGQTQPTLALLRYDALQALPHSGDRATLRLVAPLFIEPIQAWVRVDSPLHHLHELEGRTIDIGRAGSGNAWTARNAYRTLFGSGLAAAKSSQGDTAAALQALQRGEVDAVLRVGAAPPAAAGLRALTLLPGQASTARALRRYLPIESGFQHPDDPLAVDPNNGGPKNSPDRGRTLGVMSFLAVHGASAEATDRLAGQAMRRLCAALPELRSNDAAAWQAVDPAGALPAGRPYAPAALRAGAACADSAAAAGSRIAAETSVRTTAPPAAGTPR